MMSRTGTALWSRLTIECEKRGLTGRVRGLFVGQEETGDRAQRKPGGAPNAARRQPLAPPARSLGRRSAQPFRSEHGSCQRRTAVTEPETALVPRLRPLARLTIVVVALSTCALLVYLLSTHSEFKRAVPVSHTIQAAETSTLEPTAKREYDDFMKRWLASRRGTLTGHLADSRTETPIAAVSVTVSGGTPDGTAVVERAVTTDEGEFVISDLPYPMSYRLACTSEHEGIHYHAPFFMNEDGQRVEIRADRTTTVRGLVLDSDRAPVSGARVVTLTRRGSDRVESREQDATTNDDGGFQISIGVLDADDTLQVGAVARSYLPAEGDVRQVARFIWEATTVLTRGATISGRIVDEQQRPIAGLPIHVASMRRVRAGIAPPTWIMSALGGTTSVWGPKDGDARTEIVSLCFETDADGRFVVSPAFAADAVFVFTTTSDRAPIARRFLAVAQDPSVRLDAGVLVSRAPTQPVRVKVVYLNGNPAIGVRVLFQSTAVPPFAQLNSPWLTTDGSGVVTTGFLEPGEAYTIFLRDGPRSVHANLEGVVIEDGAVLSVPE